MAELEMRLGRLEEKIDMISDTLAKLAVQKEQISTIQSNVSGMWKRLDKVQDDLVLAQRWQASCPRGDMKVLWAVILSIAGAFGSVFLYHILSTGGK